MNIKTGTVEELAEMLRGCDDDADSHVVWVAFNGEVHIDQRAVFESTNPTEEYYSKTRLKNIDGIKRFGWDEHDHLVKGKMEYRDQNLGTNKFMFQFETLCQGNGYCGKDGAKDAAWVKRLLAMLKADYDQGTIGFTQFA